MKKAVITGPTGNIGISLINELINNGYDVFAVTRPGSLRNNRLKILCPNCHIIECGLEDLFRLYDIFVDMGDVRNIDEFYHVGWSSDFDNPKYNLQGQRLNVSYTEDAMRVASMMGCTKFLVVGSQAECGLVSKKIDSKTPSNPITAYAIAKCEAYERCCDISKELGINLYWPRLLSAFGPYDQGTLLMLCIDACIHKKELAMTSAEQIWDYIYADDVARVLFLIMQSGIPQKKYTIASGVGRPLKEYIEIVSEVFNYPKLMNGIGKRPYSENEVMFLVGDISEIKNELGVKLDFNFKGKMEKIKKIITIKSNILQ